MAGVAQIIVEVLVEAGKAAGEVDSLADKFDAMGKKLAGAAAGALGLAALAGFANSALNAASDLEQAMGGVDAVFKDSASAIHSWAADTSDNIRLPAAEFERLALVIGSQLKNAGVPMDQLAGKTKELIQLGGDLAAAVGGTTAEAVEALSSALKGEFDPMERYGVALKQASVNTRALQIAQGDAAKAAERSTQVQATLALITEQTADFHGQAAREADTYAAAQEHLNEVWQNFLAAAGGGALSGAGGILNLLADALTTIQPFVVAIGTLAGAFLSLPTPILAAVAAFTAFTLLRGPMMGLLSGIGTAFTNFYVSAKQLQAGAVVAGGSMNTFTAMARTAGTAAKGLGSAMLGALGGPIGIAITVALTAITLGLSKFAQDAARAKQMSEQAAAGIDQMADAIKGLDPDQIGKVGREAALSQIKMASWGKESKDLSDFNDRLGVSLDLLLDGMTGVPGASEKIEAAYQAQTKALNDTIAAGTTYGAQGEMMFDPSAQAAQENLRILDEMHSAYGPMLDVQGQAVKQNAEEAAAIAGLTDAQAAMIPTTEQVAQAYDKLKAAVKAAADATEGQGFLDAMAQAADRASRAADILGARLEALTGRNLSVEQSLVNFQRGIQDLGESFKGVGDKVPSDELAAFNVTLLNQSKEGQGAYDALVDLTSGYNDIVSQAFAAGSATGDFGKGIGDASAAADKARSDFIGMHDSMGLTEQQAQALADKLGILEGTKLDISIIADDAQAQASLKQLESLSIDPKTIVMYADDQATPEVDAKVSYIDSVTGLPKIITLGANPTSADAVLQAVLADINASHGTTTIDGNPVPAQTAVASVPAAAAATTATVNTAANTAPAEQQIGAVADGKRDAFIEVGANTTIAQQAISALIADAKNRTATIQVSAEVNPASSAVDSFTKAKRQTTVDVGAKVDQANSTINALTSAQRSTVIQVMANISPAISSISAFLSAQYKTIVTVDANTQPARNAINAVTSGSYTATITVTANTSAAQAAIAAIPRSVSVSAASAPSAGVQSFSAAPSMMASAFAAPAAGGAPPQLSRNITVPASIIINVDGALDPDAVGRQIENVMKRYDRRRNGIDANATLVQRSWRVGS